MDPVRLVRRVGALLVWGARQVGRGWHRLRNPPGWWDEIDAVYGGHEEPGPSTSAATAGIGGHISGGMG